MDSVDIPPIVTVAVLNYNGLQYLDRCLGSLRMNTNCEIILIDNASTDDSISHVKSNFPWVKIFLNRQNLGYAKANNDAATMALGKYIFFLNVDTWIEPNTIQELIKAAEKNNEVAAFAPTIMDYEGKKRLSLGLGCDIFGYPCPSNGKIFYLDGASYFIRKDIFNEVGGFDDRYFIFGEDLDLTWRIRLRGYKIAAVAMSRVYHKSGGIITGGAIRGTTYTTTLWRRYLGERNEICTLLKNYSLIILTIIMPIYLIMNALEILIFVAKGKIKAANIYIRAWLWNISNMKTTLIWRRKIQRNRMIPDGDIIKSMYRRPMKVYVFARIGIPKFADN
jgi:GT2 family glycosyltransferase